MREYNLRAWPRGEKKLWVALTLGLALLVYLYWFTISALFNIWNNYGTYSHGYLTILLSIYLIYVAVTEKEYRADKTSKFSAVLLLIISLVWLVAYFASVNTLQMLCIPFIIYFSFTYFCGWKKFKTILIPIFVLLFTIPVWTIFLPYLQNFAVVATKLALEITSLDFRLVDNAVIFSRGIFEIEESCSGLRYVLVGMLLSIVFGYLNYDNFRSTILLVLASIVIMLIANVVRILVVIGLGVYKGIGHPLVQDHENLGWLVFALFLVPLFVLARVLDKNTGAKVKSRDKAPINVTTSENDKNEWISTPVRSFVFYALVISLAPLYAHYVDSREITIKTLDYDMLQAQFGWSGPSSIKSSWSPNYFAYSEKFLAQYTKHNSAVALHILHYSKHKQEGELVNMVNRLADSEEWYIKEFHSGKTINAEQNIELAKVNIATIVSKSTKECVRVWYWFEINGNSHTKKWRVKLDDLIQRLQGRSGSSLNAVSTMCSEQPEIADHVLNDFLGAHYHEIKRTIAF